MVSPNPAPLKGGHAGHPSQGDASSIAHVLMCVETIDCTTCAKIYDTVPDNDSNRGAPKHLSTFTSPPH